MQPKYLTRWRAETPSVEMAKLTGGNLQKLLREWGEDCSRSPQRVRRDHVSAKHLRHNYLGFWYQKIARATKAMVMIQRMMSFARFFSFSSAISAVQHT